MTRLVPLLAIAWVATVETALPALAFPQELGEETARAMDSVGAILMRARAGEIRGDRASHELTELGPEGIEAVFETKCQGRFHVRLGSHGQSTRPLQPSEDQALLRAFLAFPVKDQVTLLEHRLYAGPTTRERVVALGLIAPRMKGREMEDLVLWSGPQEGEQRIDVAVRSAYGAALDQLLERQPAAVRWIPSAMENAHLALLPPTLGALSRHATPESLRALVELLGISAPADALVLVEAGQMGRALPHPIDPEVLAPVRNHLSSLNRTVLIEAVIASQHLGDTGAAPLLIELLQHADSTVVERAHLALQSMSGKHLPAKSEAWTEWHRGALDWWRNELPRSLAMLEVGASGEVSRHLMELSKRRFFRHPLAEKLSPLLQTKEPEIVLLTCAVLGHLGSAEACYALIEKLRDPSVEVRRAAYLALSRITGADHGEDPDAWTEAGW